MTRQELARVVEQRLKLSSALIEVLNMFIFKVGENVRESMRVC